MSLAMIMVRSSSLSVHRTCYFLPLTFVSIYKLQLIKLLSRQLANVGVTSHQLLIHTFGGKTSMIFKIQTEHHNHFTDGMLPFTSPKCYYAMPMTTHSFTPRILPCHAHCYTLHFQLQRAARCRRYNDASWRTTPPGTLACQESHVQRQLMVPAQAVHFLAAGTNDPDRSCPLLCFSVQLVTHQRPTPFFVYFALSLSARASPSK